MNTTEATQGTEPTVEWAVRFHYYRDGRVIQNTMADESSAHSLARVLDGEVMRRTRTTTTTYTDWEEV